MEFTKKMILVDPDTIQRLKQHESVQPNTLSLLDQEMKDVLNNSKLGDHEKWSLYNQILQRYLNIINNTRNPLNLAVVEEKLNNKKLEDKDILNDCEPQVSQDPDREILESVPKTFRDKATLLLQKLKRGDHVKWDERGIVYIKGNKITNSNITDLLNDIVRPRKNGDPIGWREFSTVLRDINIPFELIGNLKRRDYMRQLFERHQADNSDASPLNTSYDSSPVSSVTPVKRLSNFSKTNWETFKL